MSVDWNPIKIKQMREILNYSIDLMASKLRISTVDYLAIESGNRFASMNVLANLSSIRRENLYRVQVVLRENDNSNGMGFLNSIVELFPLSSGASSISPPDVLATAYLDILLPAYLESIIEAKIIECANKNNMEMVKLTLDED